MADDKKPAQDTTKADDKVESKPFEDVLYGDRHKPKADDKKADDDKGKPDVKVGDEKKPDEKKPEDKKPEGEKKPEEKPDAKPEDKKGDDKGDGEKKDDAGDGSKDDGNKDDKGKPESKVPEKYELKRPDDELWTDADVENVATHAKALGLTQEQAEKELRLRVQYQRAEATRLLTELKADPELGGKQFDKTVDVANRGLRAALSKLPEADQDAMLADLQISGRQNARWFVRLMTHFADAAAEDKPDHSGKGGSGERKSTEELFYGQK
jgi:hypothetical protein